MKLAILPSVGNRHSYDHNAGVRSCQWGLSSAPRTRTGHAQAMQRLECVA